MAQPTQTLSIDWPCEMVVASRNSEEMMCQVVHRSGEWGRGRDLPKERIDEISQACSQHGMTLYQALSLRRTMLRSFPGGMRRVNQSASMGTNHGQNQVSALFEEALVAYVRSVTAGSGSIFRTERELIDEARAGRRPHGPTPDILFLEPVIINGRSVKWIDAKLYYASAKFASNTRVPNGKLQSQAQRYNHHFGGNGAFVFGQGFCSDLQRMVPGALLLDATPLDVSAVTAYQDAN